MLNKKNYFSGIATGIIIVLGVNVGMLGFTRFSAKGASKSLTIEKKVQEIYNILDSNYVNTYEKTDLEESMYKGFVYGIGDPYTSYMDKETLKSFSEQTEGTYAGVGIVITVDVEDNRIVVISPYEGSPGAKAGVLPGDKIMKINGEDVFGDNLQNAVNMMKGPEGTPVNVTLYRDSDKSTFSVDIVREKIDIPTIVSKMLEGSVGYIRITGFDRLTYDQFMKAYNSLQKDQMKGLIIDVRNNPGGLLQIVHKIADRLIPKGFVVYTEDKQGKKEYYNSDSKQVEVPLAILVNGNSASASEVLSGAVQDTGVGVLVGTQTYGKGLVQNLFEISDGSAVKVTIAKYYTPNGVCIDGIGITPDYVVEMDDELSMKIQSLELSEDVQLQKAIEVINEKIN